MATIISDGASEDLIRAFVQFGCAEGHMKTVLEKLTSGLENGTIEGEDVAAHITDVLDEIDAIAELRRGVMLHLLETYDGDKDYWCTVKHLGVGAYTLFEAYQATGDGKILDMAMGANKRFIKALTHFLKTEITECAACFSDIIKAKGGAGDGTM